MGQIQMSLRTNVVGTKLSPTEKRYALGTIRRAHVEDTQAFLPRRGQEPLHLLDSLYSNYLVKFLNMSCCNLLGIEQNQIEDNVSLSYVRHVHQLYSVEH